MIGVATMRRLKGVQEAYVGFVIFHRKIHSFIFGYLLLYDSPIVVLIVLSSFIAIYIIFDIGYLID